MTLGERLLELAYADFQIKFEIQNGTRGSERIWLVSVSRGRYCQYVAIHPPGFQCRVESSEVDGFLLKEINRCICTIIDSEYKELTNMLAKDDEEEE